MKSRITIPALAFSAIVTLIGHFSFAGAAQAGFEMTYYEGNRQQIRETCLGEGKLLIEGLDYTSCNDAIAGVTHNCDAEGDCASGNALGVALTGNVAGRAVDVDKIELLPASAPAN
jgi:hypothetical protein